MNAPIRKPAAKPKPKTLAQQKTDFTAEGAPPALPVPAAGAVDKAAPAPVVRRDKP
jgi:hypothetical protein